MLKVILCLLVSSVCLANVVQVSSVYPDETKPTRQLKVSGSGLIFTREGRQFVFTASHVSQGQSTQVFLGKTELQIIGRRLHSKSDLELLEVRGAEASSIQAAYKDGRIEFQELPSRRRLLDSQNYVPLLDWINDPKLEIDNEFARGRTHVFKLNATGGLLNADSLVQPGMSGAPLLTRTPAEFDPREKLSNIPANLTIVRAIAIRRDRFFARAAFVPFTAMDKVLSDYLSGQPTQELKHWFARGAVLYRKARVHQEIAAFSSATAGGVIQDVGNGVTMEGGDLSTLSEDSPDRFLKKVSALANTGDHPTLYWSVPFPHPVKDEALRFGTWFDMELYPMAPGGSILVGYEEANLPDLTAPLLQRLGVTERFGSFETNTPAYLHVDSGGIVVKIPLPDDDQISFQLNQSGFYCPHSISEDCRQKFQPIFEVYSSKVKHYIIDLREFFFLDFAGSDLLGLDKLQGLNDEEQKVQVYESVRNSLAHPRILYRLAKPNILQPMTVEQGQRMIIQWSGKNH